MINKIKITKQALKELKRAPNYIQEKFQFWLMAVKTNGLEAIRQNIGWHDEALIGNRKGQRSIRLNKQWRAIYFIRPLS